MARPRRSSKRLPITSNRSAKRKEEEQTRDFDFLPRDTIIFANMLYRASVRFTITPSRVAACLRVRMTGAENMTARRWHNSALLKANVELHFLASNANSSAFCAVCATRFLCDRKTPLSSLPLEAAPSRLRSSTAAPDCFCTFGNRKGKTWVTI